MANKNIGHVVCPLSGLLSVVRADKNNNLYYLSDYGKIAPNLPQGQEWLRNTAELWIDGIAPENVTVKIIHNLLPPVVTIKAVTDKKTPLKVNAVTVKTVTEKHVKTPVKKGFLSEFMKGGWDD